MKKLKKHFKLFIGIAVLILVIFVFFFFVRGTNLENGDMRAWAGASIERRAAAVNILTGTEQDTDLMIACLDKISTLADAADMPVRDAASLCFAGIQLKENI